MAEVALHPVDSFDAKLNFWAEFPSFKVMPKMGMLYRANEGKKKTLQASSNIMWLLTLIYDRKSALYSQPLLDKSELASEDLFASPYMFADLHKAPTKVVGVNWPGSLSFQGLIDEFIAAISTPLDISLRQLELKLADRTKFIMDADYSFDKVVIHEDGSKEILKSNVDQLDKMFANTNKINELILKAMESLNSIDSGEAKGGEQESLADSNKNF